MQVSPPLGLLCNCRLETDGASIKVRRKSSFFGNFYTYTVCEQIYMAHRIHLYKVYHSLFSVPQKDAFLFSIYWIQKRFKSVDCFVIFTYGLNYK